jgi:multicomponent Na+:H+ antiporter subunit G
VISVLVTIMLATGLFFFAVGTLGIIRFPDFYTRLHAAGKCDTFAAILTLLALALFNLQEFSIENLLVSLKIMAIAVFVFVASPTATHALTEAALIVGVKPWEKKGKS